ncbi:MAG TPA: FAD-dependent oxidoreductase, partial [Micromonosporaceae bacterium]
MSEPQRSVLVVGGGLAGITAALRCADAGLRVTLVEAKRALGGLTYSFHRGDLTVDNGQHVFLRCCTAYRALLDRLGVADRVTLQDRLDIPVRSTYSDRPARLRRDELPAPAHLGRSLLGYGLLSLRQRIRFVLAALEMKRLDRADPAVDTRSFGDWLREHKQDERTIDAMWDLVGIATLNARADDASLAMAAMVFQVGLLTDAGAADIGWAAVPLQELHGSAALTALEAAGVEVHLNTKIETLAVREDGWSADQFTADDVILAVPPPVAERLLPADAIPAATGWAERLGSSPIINVHVVLDRKVL